MSFYAEVYPQWPSTLPAPQQGSGFTIESNARMTPEEYGVPKVSAFGQLAMSGKLTFLLTDAQYAVFRRFWTSDLSNGIIAFKGLFYLLGVKGEFGFKPLGKLTKQKVGPNLWRVAFDVWSWSFPTATQEEVLDAMVSIRELDKFSINFHNLLKSYYDLGNQPNGSYST